MGRASKLKAARKGQPKKEPVYNWSLEQVNAMTDRKVDAAKVENLELMLGLPAMVLTDKFGFTADQMEVFIDECAKLHQSVCTGYLTLEDIRQSLFEECGIKMQGLSKERKH